MKKVLLSLMLAMSIVAAGNAATFFSSGSPISFRTEIINKDKLGPGASRSPVCPPVVYIDDYTLSFESHVDFTLQLVSLDDETVVFETYVPSSISEVQLPSYLTGEYELRLYTTSFLFAGYIEL